MPKDTMLKPTNTNPDPTRFDLFSLAEPQRIPIEAETPASINFLPCGRCGQLAPVIYGVILEHGQVALFEHITEEEDNGKRLHLLQAYLCQECHQEMLSHIATQGEPPDDEDPGLYSLN